jgi:hypothetical protein
MKEWREYDAETGGSWVILANASQPENEQDIISLTGITSIMRSFKKPADYVSASLLSASIDLYPSKGVMYEKEFYIQIHCLADDWSFLSSKTYKADEAIQIARMFLGLKKEAAMRVWKSKKLGYGKGNRIEK